MSIDVDELVARYGGDRTRLLDMLWDIQRAEGFLPDPVLTDLAAGLGTTPDDVRETSTFYHLFRHRPTGRHVIHLADTVVGKMNGLAEVRAALERETGAPMGARDPSGTFGLFTTPCIGLSDQEPAMLVDDVVFTRLRPDTVTDLIRAIKSGRTPAEIANPDGLPTDSLEYVESLVESNIRTRGPVFFGHQTDVTNLIEDCLELTPEQLTQRVAESGLRGRGGAGFETGLKWRLCGNAESDRKHVICNADEGEPGTFKDRVLLTRAPHLVIAGMVLAAYAIGASNGIIYLRGEYTYLRDYLEGRLRRFRRAGLLGHNIAGHRGFDFDIRIQMGGGAYVCGEESALIESCEGNRGTPRLKPPFPAQAGYLGQPTCIDNVETFAVVTRLLEEGPRWFRALGTIDSTGTRLLSAAGDCEYPGIHEIEWGITLADVLDQVGASDARAVQVSGPSGECVSVADNADRRIAYEDLSCNGAFTVFDSSRDLLGIVRDHMAFFVNESCGICVPCRAGNTALLGTVDRVIGGHGCEQDLTDLRTWSTLVRSASRCGLGATSPKPILTTLANFPETFRDRLAPADGTLLPSYDVTAATSGYARIARELTDHPATEGDQA